MAWRISGGQARKGLILSPCDLDDEFQTRLKARKMCSWVLLRFQVLLVDEPRLQRF